MLSGSARAQTASAYLFSASTATFDTLVGGTTVSAIMADDAESAQFPIGFNFTFAGASYSQVKASSNGWISFTNAAPTAVQSRTNSAANVNNIGPSVQPLWDDLYGANAQSDASYLVTGPVGSRVFTMEWQRFVWYYSTTNPPSISFQVKLYEATNVIEFIYSQEPGALSTSESATIGIGASTTDYLNLNGSGATPTASSATFTTGIASKPATGQKYTFTPPPPCNGTVTAGTLSLAAQNVCSGATPGAITATGFTSGASALTLQWEESNDNGVTDPWANVVGGSGANSATYTPPAFAGTLIYYRLRITCVTNSNIATSAPSTVNLPAAPTIAASAITFSAINTTSMTIGWTSGNGGRRYVVISNTNSFTNPVNGQIAPVVAGTVYAGSGQQIIYDGTGTSVTVTGLNCNTTYYARVFEYQRCGTVAPFDYFFNTSSSATNPASQLTPQPASASLPVNNNFTGFTGSNLATVFPGWYEAAIVTASTTIPAQSNPAGTTSAWRNTASFPGTTTAALNLYTTTRNEWIVSPKIALTSAIAPQIKFKAAITDFASGSTDVGMQGTDDKVHVLVSTDGCGKTWTPVYTFQASNTTTLTNVLTDFILPLNAYVGQTIQIAFQGTDGPVDDAPDYDFHIANVVIEEAPACAVPTALTVGSVTSVSASLGWAAAGTQWQVEFGTGALGTGTRVVTGSNPYTASALASNTTYNFFVRRICGSGDTSAWATGPVFTTNCANFALPFAENFSPYPTTCWSEAQGFLGTGANTLTPGNFTWLEDGFVNVGTTGAAKINLYTTVRRDWLISPSIDLGGAGYKVIEFNLGIVAYAGTAATALGSDDTVAVVISTDNGATWNSANVLRRWTAANTPLTGGSQRVYIPIQNYSGVVKIGFYGSEGITDDLPDNDIFIDSFRVSNCTPPVVALGNDTTLCPGSSITLSSGAATSYLWNTSATTQSIAVTTPGTYSVTAFNGNPGCFAADTIVVAPANAPLVNLGNDTTICAGNTLTLNAGNTGSAYLWNPGATTLQTRVVNGTGSYSVAVTNTTGCVARDTINVTVVPLPVVALGNDTAFCAGNSIVLNAGNAGSTYLWNPGATTLQTRTVTATGTYNVAVTNSNGCVGRDTINVTVNPTPVVNIGNDTTVCGDVASLVFNAGNPGSTYAWFPSQNVTTQTYDVAAPINSVNQFTASPNISGLLWYVNVTNAAGCVGRDSILVAINFTARVSGITTTGTAPSFTFAPAADSFATAYSWDFGDGSAASLLQNPSHTYASNGTYTVRLIVSNSCNSDTATTVVTVSGLGIANVPSADMIALFPNPASNMAMIESRSNDLTLKSVQVLNALGVLVMDAPLQSGRNSIPLNGFASGVYTVRIHTDKGVIVRRFEVLR